MEQVPEMSPFAGKIGVALEKFRVWGVRGVIDYFRRKRVFRIQRNRLARCAARASVSPVPGITVIGDITGQVSLDKALRDFILNLQDAGIPCQTYDTCLKPQIPAADAARIVTPPSAFDLGRYSHIVMMYRSPLPREAVPKCRRARIVFHDSAHGVHETTPFLRASGDDIIAMSDFNHEYFRRAFASQNVFKITYPFRFRLREATPPDVLRAKLGIAADAFVVFFNFDFGSYYRKNIPAALKAFALAFGDDPKARLLFKTKGAQHSPRQVGEMMDLVASLGLGGRFVHVSRYLPRADVDGLTAACDVYLSLHKAEGFGLGMAEAMSQGKPVVATGWSANTEFCRPDTAWIVPYRMTPILPHEYPPAMKEWAEADIEAAAAALREIRNDPVAAQERAARGKAFIEEHFSLARFKADVESFLRA